MISKKFFCDLLNTVKNIEKKFDYLEKFLGQPICECDFYDYTSSILEALEENMKLNLTKMCKDLIFDFAYTHNWGENDPVELEIDGVKKSASTFEELYDLIEELTENL